MQKDVSAGRMPELDAIGGAIIRAGKNHGLDVLATRKLVAEIQERLNNLNANNRSYVSENTMNMRDARIGLRRVNPRRFSTAIVKPSGAPRISLQSLQKTAPDRAASSVCGWVLTGEMELPIC